MSKTKKTRKTDETSDESEESSTSDDLSSSESSTDESAVVRKRKHKKKSKKSKKHKSRRKHGTGSEDESSSSEEEVVKRKKHKKHKKKRKHQTGDSETDGGNDVDGGDDEVVKIQETEKILYISSGDEEKGKHLRRDKRLEELKKLRSGIGGSGGSVAERTEVREISKWDSPVDDREMDRRRSGNVRNYENNNRDRYDGRHKDGDRHRDEERFGGGGGGKDQRNDFRRKDTRRSDVGSRPVGEDNYVRRDHHHQRSGYDDRRHSDADGPGNWTYQHGHQDARGGEGGHYNAYRRNDGGAGNRNRFERTDRPYNDRWNNFGNMGRGGGSGGGARRSFNEHEQHYNAGQGQRGDHYNRRPFENNNHFNDHRRETDGNMTRRNNPFSRRINDGAPRAMDQRRSSVEREPFVGGDEQRWHQQHHQDNGSRDRDRDNRQRPGDRGRRGSFIPGIRRDQSGGGAPPRRGFDNERRGFDGDRRDRNDRRSLSRSKDNREQHYRVDGGDRRGPLRDNQQHQQQRQRLNDRKSGGGGNDNEHKQRNQKFRRNNSPKKDDEKNNARREPQQQNRSRKRSENSQHSRSNSNPRNDRDRSHDKPSKKRRNDSESQHPNDDNEPDGFEWGKKRNDHKSNDNNVMADNKSDKSPVGDDKEKPNFALSGKLTEDTNKVNGVIIKYAEPPEARKPKRRWRLYPFKGEQSLQTLYIHRQSCYLIGRDRKICDLPVDHPSCSKQHAVLQYRLVPFKRDDGTASKRIRPYLLDMESANGTFVNNKNIEPKKYVELFEKDVIKFGFSSREYVLLHENSKDMEFEDDDIELHGDDADAVAVAVKSDPTGGE